MPPEAGHCLVSFRIPFLEFRMAASSEWNLLMASSIMRLFNKVGTGYLGPSDRLAGSALQTGATIPQLKSGRGIDASLRIGILIFSQEPLYCISAFVSKFLRSCQRLEIFRKQLGFQDIWSSSSYCPQDRKHCRLCEKSLGRRRFQGLG